MQALKEFFKPAKSREFYEGGVVGVEIEVEGENLLRMVDGWRCENDNSLRGEAVEYVLPKPLPWEKAHERIKRLRLKTKQLGSVIYDTGYAGVHIHVNVADLTPLQIWRYAIAYYVVEPLLLEWCGENRRNNLFCLSLEAAPLPIEYLYSAVQECRFGALGSDEIRYSALNFKALYEYGSFEFRSMRSTLDEKVLDQWVKMLLELREFACTDYPVPNMLNDLSHQQGDFVKLLMPTAHVYLDGIDNKFDKMLDAVRNIQFHVVRFSEANCAAACGQRYKVVEEVMAARKPKPIGQPIAEGRLMWDLDEPPQFIRPAPVLDEPPVDM